MLKKILSEPLFHLILIGGALFFLYDLNNKETEAPNSPEALPTALETTAANSENHEKVSGKKEKIDTHHITERIQHFVNARQGTPSASSLEAKATRFINEELLFHEAIKLNMHHSEWVKERLVEQMQNYYEGLFIPNQPTLDTLMEYHSKHAERYRTADRLSFEQMVINPKYQAEIKRLLATNQKAAKRDNLPQSVASYTAKSLLSRSFKSAHQSSIKELFGALFVDDLYSIPPGEWVGPIHSVRGIHLVKVNEIVKGNPEQFETIQDRVLEDWVADQRALWVDQQVAQLWDVYDVKLEDFLQP